MSAEVVLDAGGLRVVFFRQQDRFAHRLEVVGEQGAAVLFQSVEGTDAERFPPSPPLQELHVEQRPGSVQVALLVGMAGKNHWSLSCTFDPALGQITFEPACRLREPPAFLGSSYRLGPDVVRAGERWQTPAGGCTLSSDALLEPQGDQVALRAAVASQLPATVLWSYRFSLEKRAAEGGF